MKKIFTCVAAILLVAGSVKSQAARFVLFEHFTQASCGPCASQNPAFESTIIIPNPAVVSHLAYHTVWPGVDPMNTYNPGEVDDRVVYYGVTGVPDVYMNGNQKNAQPGGFTQTDVDDQFSMGSPIKISVTEVDNGADRDVTVNVLTVGVVPAGSYVLYVAIKEDPIDFGTPPGSNGETHFPNVFRRMLPSTGGDPYTAAAIGSTVTFTYNYLEDAAWNLANIEAVAFIQNTVTKEVLNVGTTTDPTINYTIGLISPSSTQGTTATISSFNLSSMNTGSISENFIYTLTTDAPGDWSANFTVNSTTFTSTGTVTTAAGATNAIVVNITPGTTPFVGTYTLTVSSASTPTSPVLMKKMYVISNITDLIVNNTGGLGDGSGGNASNWEAVYTAGLASASEPGTGLTSDIILMELGSTSSLGGVNNIYYNVGWTFPSLTDVEIPNLENFLNAGGNMFIAGQDMGWEIMDAGSGYGTPTTQGFYTSYIHGGFSADGGTANTLLKTVTTDLVYGTATDATINNYYGGTYFYPDELTLAGGGTKIFGYNTGTKIGGLRYNNATYKIVYLGVGPEMLNTTNANQVIKIAHDWFYGLITDVEADQMFESTFTVYPNPTNGLLTINSTENLSNLQVFDILGNMVSQKILSNGNQTIDISSLSNGNYTLKFTNTNGSFVNKKITLVR